MSLGVRTYSSGLFQCFSVSDNCVRSSDFQLTYAGDQDNMLGARLRSTTTTIILCGSAVGHD